MSEDKNIKLSDAKFKDIFFLMFYHQYLLYNRNLEESRDLSRKILIILQPKLFQSYRAAYLEIFQSFDDLDKQDN